MRQTTDIEQVRIIAKAFLMIEPAKTEFSPLIVQHPFTNCGLCVITDGDEHKTVDITQSENNLLAWQEYVSEIIDRSDLTGIFCNLNTPYALTFLKYAEPFITRTDLSEILARVWIQSENPNSNVDVTKTDIRNLFEKADPTVLMDENERKQLSELDDTITVYRGVTKENSKNIRVFSWTLDYDKAAWFAHRFNEDGTVYSAQIDKDHIFALFNGRNESEVIVDPRYLSEIKDMDISQTDIKLQQ